MNDAVREGCVRVSVYNEGLLTYLFDAQNEAEIIRLVHAAEACSEEDPDKNPF